MFIGTYQHNLDDKGRLFVPAIYRKRLDEECIIARGLESCLYIYTLAEWNQLVEKINALSFTKKSNREFSRLFLSGAYEAYIDSKGRINIDTMLMDHAHLSKECIFIGSGNRIEVWDKTVWNQYYNDRQQIIEQISEELDI